MLKKFLLFDFECVELIFLCIVAKISSTSYKVRQQKVCLFKETCQILDKMVKKTTFFVKTLGSEL